VDKTNGNSTHQTHDADCDVISSQQSTHPATELTSAVLIEKFIIRRMFDGCIVDFFAGLDNSGGTAWVNTDGAAKTYKTMQRASDTISNMLMFDMSSYPSGREGYRMKQPQYGFDILSVLRPHNPNETDARRHNYAPERETSCAPGNPADTITEHRDYDTAACLGYQAACDDHLQQQERPSSNPFSPATAQHVAWHQGYEDYENTVWLDSFLTDSRVK
jgi:hypothetical protein